MNCGVTGAILPLPAPSTPSTQLQLIPGNAPRRNPTTGITNAPPQGTNSSQGRVVSPGEQVLGSFSFQNKQITKLMSY